MAWHPGNNDLLDEVIVLGEVCLQSYFFSKAPQLHIDGRGVLTLHV